MTRHLKDMKEYLSTLSCLMHAVIAFNVIFIQIFWVVACTLLQPALCLQDRVAENVQTITVPTLPIA